MKIFLMILFVMLFLLFCPWPLTLQGDFWWKPKGKKHQVLLYGKMHYLLLRKQPLFYQQMDDAMLVERLLQWGADYKTSDLFPDICFRSFVKWIKKYLPRFRVKNFEWETRLGIGDAAYTALGCGILWAVQGSVMLWLRQLFGFDFPCVRVTPEYGGAQVQMHFECIIQVSFAQIIGITGFYLLAGHKQKSKNNTK